MSHIRQQIRAAILAKLTGLPTTGGNVFQTRVWPVNDSELPCLLIMTDADMINSYSDGSLVGFVPRSVNRTLHLTIVAVVRGVAIDDALDAICLDVEKALAADRFLGGLSANITLSDTRIQFKGEGEKPTGEATMSWLIEYWVSDTTPDVKG